MGRSGHLETFRSDLARLRTLIHLDTASLSTTRTQTGFQIVRGACAASEILGHLPLMSPRKYGFVGNKLVEELSVLRRVDWVGTGWPLRATRNRNEPADSVFLSMTTGTMLGRSNGRVSMQRMRNSRTRWSSVRRYVRADLGHRL